MLEHPPEDVRTEALYLERLREHRFPAASCLKTVDGSPFFQHRGHIIQALPRLPGVHPELTPQVSRSIGHHLARLHLLPPNGLPERNHWLRPSYLSAALALVQSHFPGRAGRVAAALQSLAAFQPTDLPQSIVHGDMSPTNCLFEGDRLSAFLDWEEVGTAPAVLDLAICVLNFCFRGNELQAEWCSSLLEGYQEVRPLTATERASLPLAVGYAGLTLSVWSLLQFGLYHPYEDKLEDRRDFWTMRLDTLDLSSFLR